MSIPNEALQKLLTEIEREAAQSTQQITIVKAAIGAKQRESRMLQLTTSELDVLASDTNVYEGVGRAFIRKPKSSVTSQLAEQSKKLKDETTNLEKKLHYLETTAKNSRGHIERLLNGGGGGGT